MNELAETAKTLIKSWRTDSGSVLLQELGRRKARAAHPRTFANNSDPNELEACSVRQLEPTMFQQRYRRGRECTGRQGIVSLRAANGKDRSRRKDLRHTASSGVIDLTMDLPSTVR
jgi:hypothetical protein